MEALKALRCVDEVIASDYQTGAESIVAKAPAIYVKGEDYGSGIADEEATALAMFNGRLEIVGEKLGSSSATFRHEDPFLEHCRATYTPKDFSDAIESLATLKVGVIGDGIFDRYTYVEPQGLTAKSQTLSLKIDEGPLSQEGGALAVWRHAEALGVSLGYRHTPVVAIKHRYLGRDGRRYFTAESYTPVEYAAPVPSSATDVLLVADFGHGVMTPELKRAVLDAKYLALNVQTNSANFGFNLITQYERCDMFSLDRTELQLAIRQRVDVDGGHLSRVGYPLLAKRGFLTRGGDDTIAWERRTPVERKDQDVRHTCPALEPNPVDPVGAGDAFFVAAALCSAKGVPLDLTLLIAQIAGAQLTKVIGNAEPLNKAKLLAAGKAILAR